MSTISRTGTIEGQRVRKDGSIAHRIRWYDSEGARRSEVVTGDRRVAQRRLDLRLREAEQERVGLRERRKETGPPLSELAIRAEREFMPLRQKQLARPRP